MRSFFHFIVPFLCFCFCFFYLLGFLQLDPRLRPRKRKRPLITCKIKTRRSHSKIRRTRSDNRSQPAILSPDSSHMKSRSGGRSCYFFWKLGPIKCSVETTMNFDLITRPNQSKGENRRPDLALPETSKKHTNIHQLPDNPLPGLTGFPFGASLRVRLSN